MSFHDPKTLTPAPAAAPVEAQPVYYTPEAAPVAEVAPLAALDQMFGYYG